jgi:DNA repair protein RadC
VRPALRAVLRESGCARAYDGFAAACCAVPTGNPAREGSEDTIMSTLYVREGGEYREATASDVFQRAQALMAQRFRAGTAVLDSPGKMREFLRLRLGTLDHEVFSVLFLTSRHRLIEYVELFRGTLDGASVHPREVVKEALARNAGAVICCHAHPSGDPTPSQADELVTRRLKAALELVQIRLLDHLVIGESISSMCELGLM